MFCGILIYMKRIKVSVYADKMGLTPQTIRNQFHKGMIPGVQLPTGTILLDDPEEVKTDDY